MRSYGALNFSSDGGDSGAGGCLQLPYLADEKAAEPLVSIDELEITGAERGGVVWQAVHGEPSEEAEGRIETPDDESCRDRKQTGGNREFGDDPAGSRTEQGANALSEGMDFGSREAVEKEVSDDEVVVTAWCELARVGAVQIDAILCSDSGYSITQKTQHRRAQVDAVGMESLILA